jgi:hypothetical protein
MRDSKVTSLAIFRESDFVSLDDERRSEPDRHIIKRLLEMIARAVRSVAYWFMTHHMYRSTSRYQNLYERYNTACVTARIIESHQGQRSESRVQKILGHLMGRGTESQNPDFWLNQLGRNLRAALCWLVLGSAIAASVVLILSPAAPAGCALAAATWQAILIGSAACFSLGVPLWLDALFTQAQSGADCVGYWVKLLLSSILMSPFIMLLLPHSAALTLSGWLGSKVLVPSLGTFLNTCALGAAVSALYQAGMHLVSAVLLFLGAPKSKEQHFSAKQRLLTLMAKGLALLTPFSMAAALYSVATQFAWLPQSVSGFFGHMSSFEALALCSSVAAVPATTVAVVCLPIAVIKDHQHLKQQPDGGSDKIQHSPVEFQGGGSKAVSTDPFKLYNPSPSSHLARGVGPRR